MDLYEDFMPWNQTSHILLHKHDDDDQVFFYAKIEVRFKFYGEIYLSCAAS